MHVGNLLRGAIPLHDSIQLMHPHALPPVSALLWAKAIKDLPDLLPGPGPASTVRGRRGILRL
eukprot:14222659-Alexandrium_andersonii.AAC.1